MRLLSSFGVFLKTAIMATIADRHFRVFAELNESPNFFDVPSNLPFPETPTDFEIRKSKQQLAGNAHNAVCYLARLRKLELTPATSCKDREFSIPCEIATSCRLDCLFLRKL